MFRLILLDSNPNICTEWSKEFVNEISRGDVVVRNQFFNPNIEFDCIVSPANSFGLMDGSFDAVITSYFGVPLMKRVQKYIIENYSSEQPIGTSFIVETFDEDHPYLVHTPTMSLPLDIRGTLNVYYAMKSMLETVNNFNISNGNKIKSVLCTGLGSGCGLLNAEDVAKQMSLAYKHFTNKPSRIDWKYANERFREVQSLIKG